MPTRRARKSVEQWSELVDRFDSSSDSIEQFCQQQNLALSTFQRWRSTIHRSKGLGSAEAVSGFTRVTIPSVIPPATPSVPATVKLQIGTSITVTIHTAESI